VLPLAKRPDSITVYKEDPQESHDSAECQYAWRSQLDQAVSSEAALSQSGVRPACFFGRERLFCQDRSNGHNAPADGVQLGLLADGPPATIRAWYVLALLHRPIPERAPA
jgi:hypothetical protein